MRKTIMTGLVCVVALMLICVGLYAAFGGPIVVERFQAVR